MSFFGESMDFLNFEEFEKIAEPGTDLTLTREE